MKKLMVLVAIACASIVTQASSVNWKLGTGKTISVDAAGTKYTGTGYMFDSGVLSQSSLLAAFLADDKLDLSKQTGMVSSSGVANGAVTAGTAAAYGTTGSSYDMYFAIVNDGKLYISDVKSYAATAGAETTTLKFNASNSKTAPITTGVYADAGWYGAVPEPTSGLLVLLGLGVMALRRRRV